MINFEQQITKFKEIAGESSVLYSLEKIIGLLSEREYDQQELQHTLEVYDFSVKLLQEEEIQDNDVRKVVLIAAIVHDVGRYLEDESIKHHTELTDQHITGFIDPLMEPELVDRILKCAQRHSLGSKQKPETLEEKIVFDADNLTIFTEFGFKRWFFKAEDWGKVKNAQEADAQLADLYQMARSGELLHLASSRKILRESFYARTFENK